MASVVRASLQALVSWGTLNLGTFVIGTSTISGTDGFGVSPSDPTFGGQYDDVSRFVRGYTWSRGRGTNPGEMNPGAGSLTLEDRLGILNPAEPTSPLYNVMTDRLHPVRLRQTYSGVVYPRFWGWARDPVYQPGQRRSTLTLQLVDMWYWLDRVNPIIASTGTTTTGAVLSLVFDAAGWPANQRILDVGDVLPDFSADGSISGTEIVTNLLQAEGGTVWQDASGNAVYHDRLYRLTRTSVATIVNKMTNLQPTGSQDDVYNRVTLTRTQTGHISTATDTISADKVGFNDLTFESAYFASDAAQDQRALWILSQQKQARVPVDSFTIDNREDALMLQMLQRDILDRITAQESSAGSNGDFHIDGVTETLDDDGNLTANWQLSAVSSTLPLLIGAGAGAIGTGVLV